MPNTDEPQVLTVEEAARVLGVSRWLAYEQARSGSLGGVPVLRIGRRYVVPKPALERAVGVAIDEPEPREQKRDTIRIEGADQLTEEARQLLRGMDKRVFHALVSLVSLVKAGERQAARLPVSKPSKEALARFEQYLAMKYVADMSPAGLFNAIAGGEFIPGGRGETPMKLVWAAEWELAELEAEEGRKLLFEKMAEAWRCGHRVQVKQFIETTNGQEREFVLLNIWRREPSAASV